MKCPFEEVLLLCLLAVLAGAEGFVDIARYGEKKLDFLRRFLPFKNGTPSHHQIGDIFATLDAEKFQTHLVAWVSSYTGVMNEVIAVDGKSVRCSYQKKGKKDPALTGVDTWAGKVPGCEGHSAGTHRRALTGEHSPASTQGDVTDGQPESGTRA